MDEKWYKWVFSGIGLLVLGVLGAFFKKYWKALNWEALKKIRFLSKSETKPVESIKIVDILDAHDLWSDFKGDLFCWNPSWQTEMHANPNAWEEIHINRYKNDQVNRVVYIIGKQGNESQNRKFFYLNGLKNFLKLFLNNHPKLRPALEKKIKIYIKDKLPSDLTFFVGTKASDSSKVSILMINDEPFISSEMPRSAFVTGNENIYNDMLRLILAAMGEEDISIAEILNEISGDDPNAKPPGVCGDA